MTEIQSYAIKNIRVVSTLMIFLCHTVFLFGETVGLTAQFFNIAVTVFFFISAYLYSLRENVSAGGVLQWYKKRFLRISIPYYIYIILLFVLYLFLIKKINIVSWITTALIISGITETYMPETGHLWFITAIFICYLITPVLYKIRKNNKISALFIIFSITLYFPIAFFVKDIIATYYWSVFEFVIAFFFLEKLINKLNDKSGIVIGFVSLVFGCIIKLLGVHYFDSTIFYTKFIVEICSLLIAFGIFSVVFFLTAVLKKIVLRFSKIIDFFDSISYEFFIVHMIFIKGNFSVLKLSNPFLNICLAFVLSLIFGYLLHILSNQIFKVIKWRKKH